MEVFSKAIVKSENDARQYRFITLENKLQAVIVSDPETEKSAACCDVNVGSLSDPPEALGLAHFLEHMLFMGTETYPEENAYTAFLNSHGGSSNAYTDDENTVYYFDVQNGHFEGALDLFASFFICPLFSESGVMREINAVDSENSKNLQSDSWRKYQLFKNLAREDHPMNAFSTGNLQTLHEVPESKGMNIRQLMIDFYQKFYSANIMKVAMYGKEPLDVMERWVVEKFSKVPNKNLSPQHFPTDPFRYEQTRKLVEFVPVRDIKNVEIMFPIPAEQHLYFSKPTQYLSHLLGHESEGSILSALKKKLWANGLSSYLFQDSKDFACFSVNIELSDDGVQNINEIVGAVFAYIGMLHREGIDEWIYHELKDIAEMKFRFLDKKEPSNYVIRLANNMHTYQPEHIISGSYLFYEHKPELIQHFLGYLRPENSIIIVNHKGLENQTTLEEKWYKTKYNLKEYDPVAYQKWQEELLGQNKDYSWWYHQVHLPKPNPFVPTDFTLYTKEPGSNEYPALLNKSVRTEITIEETKTEGEGEEAKKESAENADKMEVDEAEEDGEGEEEDDDEEGDDDDEDEDDEEDGNPPQASGAKDDEVNGLIRSNLLGVSTLAWVKEDTNWKKPKLNVVLSLENSFATNNPWSIAMSDLFILILKELLNEYSYYADCSGLYYNIRLNRCGIEFLFRGYHHKLPILIERVCQEMMNLSENKNPSLYASLFALMKPKLLRTYKNTLYTQPYYHNILGSTYCLEDPRFSALEKFEILNQSIDCIDDVIAFIKVFLKQLKYEIFINGNYSKELAFKEIIENKILNILKANPLPFNQQLIRRSLDIFSYAKEKKLSEFLYRQSAMTYNKQEVNSSTENIYFIGLLPTADDIQQKNEEQESVIDANEPIYEKDLLLKETLIHLFIQLMSDEAFDLLRTKEQLGYIVFTGLKKIAQHVAGIHIIVQSHHKDAIYLDDRIENFLQYYYENFLLVTLTNEKLQDFITAVKEKLLEKPKNLDEETDRLWEEISSHGYLFERNKLLVEKLDTPGLITKELLLNFYTRYFYHPEVAKLEIGQRANPRNHPAHYRRIKFSAQFFGCKTTFPSPNQVQPVGVHLIKDPSLFKRKVPLLPLLSSEPF